MVHFENYGKDVIKKHKVSPDAWVQMVKQLAYGKMTGGKPAVTYESAQTRKFRLGRTEVIRSASNQSKAFVDAMLDPNGSVSTLWKHMITMGIAKEPIHISTRAGCRKGQTLPSSCGEAYPVCNLGCRRPGCRSSHVRPEEALA